MGLLAKNSSAATHPVSLPRKYGTPTRLPRFSPPKKYVTPAKLRRFGRVKKYVTHAHLPRFRKAIICRGGDPEPHARHSLYSWYILALDSHLMSLPAQLLRLEQLDGELTTVEQQLADLRRQQLRDPELEAAEQKLAALRTEDQQAAVQQRALESDLSDLEARIKRDHDRMYGGMIVDARELSSLEKELASYRSRRDALEERVLEGMERSEVLQAEIAGAQEQLEALRARRVDEKPVLAAKLEELTAAGPKLQAERAGLTEEIDPRSLSLYVRIRAHSGHAVSRVTDGVCQWCRVVIPPKDIHHARAGALVTCTNCARILYAGS
jgi:uncharacterized protein